MQFYCMFKAAFASRDHAFRRNLELILMIVRRLLSLCCFDAVLLTMISLMRLSLWTLELSHRWLKVWCPPGWERPNLGIVTRWTPWRPYPHDSYTIRRLSGIGASENGAKNGSLKTEVNMVT
jgi:hypothetical protein